jgi:hypothetical protein
MGRKPKQCPCSEHKGEFVAYSTWHRHVQMLAQGSLDRWEATDEAHVEEGSSNDPTVEIKAQEQVENPIQPAVERGVHESYAYEIAELVARNRVNVTGAEAMLKCTHRHYDSALPNDLSLPSTWYECKRIALEGNEAQHFTRDFCPGCDFLFPTDVREKRCPNCEKSTRFKNGKARRQAYYYDISDKIRRIYKSKYLARHASYGTSRPRPEDALENRELVDCWDAGILGTLFHDLPDLEKEDYLYLAQSNDGVEVEKNVTYTPITAYLLNLPPDMRGAHTYACTHAYKHTQQFRYAVLFQHAVLFWCVVPFQYAVLFCA